MLSKSKQIITILQKKQKLIVMDMINTKNKLKMHDCNMCCKKTNLSFNILKNNYSSIDIEKKLYITNANAKILEKIPCKYPFLYFKFHALSYKWFILDTNIKIYGRYN